MFVLFCIVIMWPMLFSVPVLYGASTKETQVSDTLTMATVGMLAAFLAWVIIGYPLVYGKSLSVQGLLYYFAQLQAGDSKLLLSVTLQACFFLYAAGMFIGTMIHKVRWSYFTVFIPLWLVLVYSPVAYFLWNEGGLFNQWGALDFSGGMVVHVTAGFTSFFLAKHFHGNEIKVKSRTSDLGPSYIATVLICFGWFGFNLGPLEGINSMVGLVTLNTCLSIIGGSLGFLLTNLKNVTSDDLLSGMVVGLVTSTCLVGYTSPLQIFITTLFSGIITSYLVKKVEIDDPVDSYIMNGLGGLIGTLGAMLFVNPQFTPDGQAGLLSGELTTFPLVQLLALILTIGITWIGSYCCIWICNQLYFGKKEKEDA